MVNYTSHNLHDFITETLWSSIRNFGNISVI